MSTRVVAFDGACLGQAHATGVERSFLLALDAFARPADVHCVVFCPRGSPHLLPPVCEVRSIPRRGTFGWREYALPRALRELRPHALLSPTTALPPRAPCPCIATVHELPALHRAEENAIYGLRQDVARERLGRRAARVIVPSQQVARDLHRRHPELAGRVSVIPQPLDPAFLRAAPAGRGGAGLVFVGVDRRRKNLTRLLRAHASLPAALRRTHPLYCVGGAGRREAIDGVVALPPLSTARLIDLLRDARALVLPSLSEGFGLPALEALAVGLPVLAARGSVTVDLCGDLAVAVDPWDQAALAAGMLRLLRDDRLRTRAGTQGPAIARAFTPERTASGWRVLVEGIEIRA